MWPFYHQCLNRGNQTPWLVQSTKGKTWAQGHTVRTSHKCWSYNAMSGNSKKQGRSQLQGSLGSCGGGMGLPAPSLESSHQNRKWPRWMALCHSGPNTLLHSASVQTHMSLTASLKANAGISLQVAFWVLPQLSLHFRTVAKSLKFKRKWLKVGLGRWLSW